ncbi:hypothetical protein PROFUN_16480, partial [Planoprotostelium fungivorum]
MKHGTKHSTNGKTQGTESLPPIVLVPGVQGTQLYTKEGKKIWASTRQVLNLESTRLDLPLEWDTVDDDPEDPYQHRQFRQKSDGIVAGDILMHVARVPIYKRFIKRCKKEGRKFYPFLYDWRRDLNEAAHNLILLLKRVYSECGRPAQVVGHSNGGLIVYAALNDPENTYLFDSTLFVGTPFSPMIDFLEFMHVGVPT